MKIRIFAILLAALMILPLASCGAGNTYESPIKLMESDYNSKSFSFISIYKDAFNGLSSSNVKTICDILGKIEMGGKTAKEAGKEQVAEWKEEYGSNYKFKLTITDKEKLEEDDLKSIEEKLVGYFENMAELDVDDDAMEAAAEQMGIKTKDVKSLVKAIKGLGKDLKGKKVTDGYKLTVTQKVTGKNLDEPQEEEETMRVVKFGGRWVAVDMITSAIRTFGSML